MIQNVTKNLSQGATGSASPAYATLVGGSDGSNLRALSTSASGVLNVSLGSVAHDAVLTGVNPVLMGGYGSTSTPTAVSAAGDMVQAWYDLNGRQAIWDGNTTISIDDGGGAITVDGTVSISGSVTVTGTVTANAGTGFAAVATAGSAVVTTGYHAMGSDGTNARIFRTDASGNQTNVGVVAADAPASGAGNPLYMAGYGSTATPAAMSADGDLTPFWLTRNGALNIADAGGNISIDDGGNSITVDGSVTVSGTVTANAGTGFAAVATTGSAVPTTGYVAMCSDGTNARPQLADTSGRQIVVGAAATDAVVAGNPVYIGGYGSTATPAAMSADGDMTPLWLTRNGAVNIADAGSTISIDDGGGSVTVDGSVSITGSVTVTGTVTANAGTGFAAVATTGSAIPTTGYVAMGNDGTNARPLSTSTTGVLNVALPQATSATNLTIDCLVTATQLHTSSANRKGWMIVNNSPTTDVYIGVNNSVTLGNGTAGANRGLLLSPGGSVNMSLFAGYQGDIYGIADGATAKIGVMYW